MFNPYIEIIIATLIWGSAGPFVKYINLPPTTLAAFRLGVPAAILLVYFWIKKVKLKLSKTMLFASVLNALRMPLYFFAYTVTSIGNAVILLYTWPIFAAIFGALILKERLSKKKIGLLGVAFIGMILMFLNKNISFGNRDLLGMLAMIVVAAIYAITIVIFKKESGRHTQYETVFFQNVVGGIVFLPFVFINPPTLLQSSVASIYSLLIGLVGFSLFFSALKKLKASTASLLAYLEVVSGVLFGIILFGEVLTVNMVIGGLMIICATMMLRK